MQLCFLGQGITRTRSCMFQSEKRFVINHDKRLPLPTEHRLPYVLVHEARPSHSFRHCVKVTFNAWNHSPSYWLLISVPVTKTVKTRPSLLHTISIALLLLFPLPYCSIPWSLNSVRPSNADHHWKSVFFDSSDGPPLAVWVVRTRSGSGSILVLAAAVPASTAQLTCSS